MATAGARIVEIADLIVADIRSRGLTPGDAYLSTAETARLLRVSGSTVNRALQLLSKRGIIHRRQRQGTVIADPSSTAGKAVLGRVHLVVREDHLRAEGLWAEGVLLGLQEALPGAEIQFNFRPETDEADYVRQLVHEILSARRVSGLVLIRSTVVTQRVVAASGLPAVVSGTLQPSIRDLPSVDRDQRQIGILLAEHLLGARCRSFLVLMRDRLTAGDHAMLDGALKTLANEGISLEDVKIRCLPSDSEAIAASAVEHLERERARVGCLCRSELLARGVDAAAAAAGLRDRRRPAIVVADASWTPADRCPYPCIETTVSPGEWGAALGQTLLATARGERPNPYRRVIPVRLWTPEEVSS